VGNGSIAKNTTTGTKAKKASFFARDGSFWARVTGTGGTARPVWVSDVFEVVSLGQTLENNGWCAVITFDDPDGCEQKVAIPFAALARDRKEVIADLAQRGLMVSPTRLGRDLFAEFLQSATWHVEARIAIRKGRTGATEFVGNMRGRPSGKPQ
jgi:hypothetical protein